MRMKRQGFTEVCENIRGIVVAGIKVEFVCDAFGLQLTMQLCRAFFKSEFIFAAAIKIDGQSGAPNQCPILPGEDKWTVLVPVTEVNGIAEHRSHESTKRCRCTHGLSLRRRFCNKRGTLCADRRE